MAKQVSTEDHGLKRAWLWLELWLVFVGGPTALVLAKPEGRWLIPTLLGLAVVCLVVLLTDRTFDRRRFGWGPGGLAGVKPAMRIAAARFAFAAVGVLGLAYAADRAGWIEIFGFAKRVPHVWVIVMVLYPIFSVYPQTLIYRGVVMHRYRALVGSGWAMVATSGLLFGYSHIIMWNWESLALTLVGGLMFADTFRRSGSLLVAAMEHAAYGCLMFTVGFGRSFLYGPGSLPLFSITATGG